MPAVGGWPGAMDWDATVGFPGEGPLGTIRMDEASDGLVVLSRRWCTRAAGGLATQPMAAPVLLQSGGCERWGTPAVPAALASDARESSSSASGRLLAHGPQLGHLLPDGRGNPFVA